MTNLRDPRALLHIAATLQREGRLQEAEAAYVRLLEVSPDLPDCWYELALLQRRAGRFEAALASYQQALDRGVSQPEEVHLNRGVIYSDCLRQDTAAEKELQAALARNPNYVPALLNLANLREDFGRRDDALALYEQILALEPEHHEALARYANLKKIERADDPLLERLRQASAHRTASAADRASLGFVLGAALDACGAWDEALNAYKAANLASRECAGAGVKLYDRARHEHFIGQLIAAFSGAGATSAQPSAAVRPIFICGMFRSGSTLTEQVLAAHSRVSAGGELAYVPALVRNALAPFPAGMTNATPQQLQLLAAGYLQALSQLFPEGGLVTDKRPDNFLYIGLIKRLFPDAKIIHTTRNPLDNCLSIFFLHLDHSMGYALDLDDTAHYYVQHLRLMAHWKALYGADLLDFNYDAFVREPRAAIERLLGFCGLDWEEQCLAFHRVDSAVKTASVWQVREPVYQRSSGRARHYPAAAAVLRNALRGSCPDVDRE